MENKFQLPFIFLLPLFMSFSGLCQPKKTAIIYSRAVTDTTKLEGARHDLQKHSGFAGSCDLWFKNDTGYFIDIWYELYYQGRLSPFEIRKLSAFTPGNWTYFEARTLNNKLQWKNNSYCNENKLYTLKVRYDSSAVH